MPDDLCPIPHRRCINPHCGASLIYCSCPALHLEEHVAVCGACSVTGGWPVTPDHAAKLLASHTGKPLTAAHREKIAARLRGRYVSQETRLKQSMSQKSAGPKPPISIETRNKLAAHKRGKPGTPWTPEHRAKVLATKALRKQQKKEA